MKHLLVALALAPRIFSAGVFLVPSSIPCNRHHLLIPSSLSHLCPRFMFFFSRSIIVCCHVILFCFLPFNVLHHIAHTRLPSHPHPVNSRLDSSRPPPYFELVLCLLYHPPNINTYQSRHVAHVYVYASFILFVAPVRRSFCHVTVTISRVRLFIDLVPTITYIRVFPFVF